MLLCAFRRLSFFLCLKVCIYTIFLEHLCDRVEIFLQNKMWKNFENNNKYQGVLTQFCLTFTQVFITKYAYTVLSGV